MLACALPPILTSMKGSPVDMSGHCKLIIPAMFFGNASVEFCAGLPSVGPSALIDPPPAATNSAPPSTPGDASGRSLLAALQKPPTAHAGPTSPQATSPDAGKNLLAALQQPKPTPQHQGDPAGAAELLQNETNTPLNPVPCTLPGAPRKATTAPQLPIQDGGRQSGQMLLASLQQGSSGGPSRPPNIKVPPPESPARGPGPPAGASRGPSSTPSPSILNTPLSMIPPHSDQPSLHGTPPLMHMATGGSLGNGARLLAALQAQGGTAAAQSAAANGAQQQILLGSHVQATSAAARGREQAASVQALEAQLWLAAQGQRQSQPGGGVAQAGQAPAGALSSADSSDLGRSLLAAMQQQRSAAAAGMPGQGPISHHMQHTVPGIPVGLPPQGDAARMQATMVQMHLGRGQSAQSSNMLPGNALLQMLQRSAAAQNGGSTLPGQHPGQHAPMQANGFPGLHRQIQGYPPQGAAQATASSNPAGAALLQQLQQSAQGAGAGSFFNNNAATAVPTNAQLMQQMRRHEALLNNHTADTMRVLEGLPHAQPPQQLQQQGSGAELLAQLQAGALPRQLPTPPASAPPSSGSNLLAALQRGVIPSASKPAQNGQVKPAMPQTLPPLNQADRMQQPPPANRAAPQPQNAAAAAVSPDAQFLAQLQSTKRPPAAVQQQQGGVTSGVSESSFLSLLPRGRTGQNEGGWFLLPQNPKSVIRPCMHKGMFIWYACESQCKDSCCFWVKFFRCYDNL